MMRVSIVIAIVYGGSLRYASVAAVSTLENKTSLVINLRPLVKCMQPPFSCFLPYSEWDNPEREVVGHH